MAVKAISSSTMAKAVSPRNIRSVLQNLRLEQLRSAISTAMGLLDIVIGDEAGGGAFIYFNQGNLKFSEPMPIAEKTDILYSIAIADMNGDGHADVVSGNEKTPGAVLINDGTGRKFTLVRFGDNKGAVYGLAIGDVNGDGSPDIVAARSGAPSMLYLNSLVLKRGPASSLTSQAMAQGKPAYEQRDEPGIVTRLPAYSSFQGPPECRYVALPLFGAGVWPAPSPRSTASPERPGR